MVDAATIAVSGFVPKLQPSVRSMTHTPTPLGATDTARVIVACRAGQSAQNWGGSAAVTGPEASSGAAAATDALAARTANATSAPSSAGRPRPRRGDPASRRP